MNKLYLKYYMSAFIITLRETLEAAIIIAIIFSILKAFGLGWDKKIYVIYGIIFGIICSILFSFLIEVIFGKFEGKVEKGFEGVLMLTAVGMITHFVIWTNAHFKNVGVMLKKGIQKSMEPGKIWLLSILAFVSVIREGVETVIFLKSAEFAELSGGVLYALGGFLTAGIIATSLFLVIKNINLANIIRSTNILFILLGAGLLSHSISEFEGAGIIPKIIKPLFDLNSTFFTEESGFGALFKAAISYDANPSLIAFAMYVIYILALTYLVFFRKKTI